MRQPLGQVVMRKLGWSFLIIVLLVALAATILPGWIERQQNQIDGRPPAAEVTRQLMALIDGEEVEGHMAATRMRKGTIA